MVSKLLRISMLGSFQVQLGPNSAEFRTDAQRILLAYLAAHQGIPQRRDTLANLLSPDRPDKEARIYLSNRLTRLRRTLDNDGATPPWLSINRKQIALRMGDDISVDVAQFDQLLKQVQTHPHRQLAGCPTCLVRLQTAIKLMRGELLAGLNFSSETWESWLLTQREHYQQQALEAMTLLRDAQTARGDWAAVLLVAQHQLSIEPWLESAHRAVMRAHYRLGNRSIALAQYERCEKLLYEELGIDPDDETLTLAAKIRTEDVKAQADVVTYPSSLPAQMGPFFGRKTEQTRILNLLIDPTYQLVTIVGTGGIGKTRLSIEIGKQVVSSFPDGVWFVPLDVARGNAEQIKIAVGEAVGLAQDGKQLTGEQVIARLRDKRMLLIFDNSEPVLEEIAFIPEWLRRAPNITILATSREPLNFQAETVVMIDGLPIGDSEMSAAEALFAERGKMARAEFVVSAENLPQIRQICQLVDGSPLGITLAAAWVRRRSLAQIIDSIGRSLDFLSTRLRDVDPRHRSMRAVLETSWQLLLPEEQMILATLSVFPATFSAEAAQQIANATLFDLDILCEKSLLHQEQESERYGMHGLVRHFSADKLANRQQETDHAFVSYFYQYASTYQWQYDQLQFEWHNFSAGIVKAHALARWQMVLDFVQVLDEARFRQVRFHEMREGLALAVDAAKILRHQTTLANILLRLGEIEMEQNEYDGATRHLNEALDHFNKLEDRLGIANAKYLIGRVKSDQTQDDEAIKLFEDSKQIFEAAQVWLGVAKNLNLIAVHYFKTQRDFQTAHTYLQRALDLQSNLPLSAYYIETLRYLARVQIMSGEYARAEEYLDDALSICRQQHDLGEYAIVLYERVLLHKTRGQFEQALQLGRECLNYIKRLGSVRAEAIVQTQIGLLYQTQGQFEYAAALLNKGLQIFIEIGDLYEQAYSYYYLHKVYAELNAAELSASARRHAYTINLELKDPQLTARLE